MKLNDACSLEGKLYVKSRQRVKTQRHHFANKGPYKSYGHVRIWELDPKECWAQRIDAFELWCWRRLLRVPWTVRKSNQSVLKNWKSFIGRTDAEAEAPILWPPDKKGPTLWKRPLCWERLKAEGEGAFRGWDGWMTSLTQWTWIWASSRK